MCVFIVDSHIFVVKNSNALIVTDGAYGDERLLRVGGDVGLSCLEGEVFLGKDNDVH